MNRLRRFVQDFGPVPVVPLAGSPGIQCTGTSLREALFDARAQIEALKRLYEKVLPDAVFTMMDLTVEVEFLGSRLNISENDPPAVSEPLLGDEGGLEKLFSDKAVGGRMPLFAEVVSGLKQAVDVPIGAYVIGPLTLAGEIMELARVMKATRKNPERLHRVLQESTGLITRYIALLEDAGADVICVLEPSAMMVSETHFKEFSGSYLKTLFSKAGSAMRVLHICGDTNHMIPAMEDTGADGLSLDKQVDLAEAYDRLGRDTVLIGNIDPVSVMTLGGVDLVREKCEDLLRNMGGRENFILSTGCDVPQTAPIENIVAMAAMKAP